jgi:hypothetical protein
MNIPRTCAVSPADQEAALLTAYRAFNARDIDRALAVMTDDIDWPNGWEGGRVSGKDAVRAYWTRQWAEIDPHIEPVGFTALNHGRIRATVQQTVRTLNGAVLTDGVVLHTYAFRGGLIARMDTSEPGP